MFFSYTFCSVHCLVAPIAHSAARKLGSEAKFIRSVLFQLAHLQKRYVTANHADVFPLFVFSSTLNAIAKNYRVHRKPLKTDSQSQIRARRRS